MEIIEVEKLLGILVRYSFYAFNQGDFLDFLRFFFRCYFSTAVFMLIWEKIVF